MWRAKLWVCFLHSSPTIHQRVRHPVVIGLLLMSILFRISQMGAWFLHCYHQCSGANCVNPKYNGHLDDPRNPPDTPNPDNIANWEIVKWETLNGDHATHMQSKQHHPQCTSDCPGFVELSELGPVTARQWERFKVTYEELKRENQHLKEKNKMLKKKIVIFKRLRRGRT
jgi:hypothetical protein